MITTLLDLPDDLLDMIASYLHPYWLKRFRRTCRKVEGAVHHEVLKQCFSHRNIYLDNELQLDPLRLLVLDPDFGPALKSITFHIWALNEITSEKKEGIAKFFAALSQRQQPLQICVRLKECEENRYWREENYVFEYYEWIHRHASRIDCIQRCPTLSICSPAEQGSGIRWGPSLWTPKRWTLFKQLATLASSGNLEIVYHDQPQPCGLSYSNSKLSVVTTGLLPGHDEEIELILRSTGNS